MLNYLIVYLIGYFVALILLIVLELLIEGVVSSPRAIRMVQVSFGSWILVLIILISLIWDVIEGYIQK